MSSQRTACREIAVIWVGTAVEALDSSVRASWEAHVFHSGDRVTVDPDLDTASRARCARLIDCANRAGTSGMTVAETVITVTSKRSGFTFTVTCKLDGFDGSWPHEALVDIRPIDRISGAVVTRGVSTWLIPLVDGSLVRNYECDPVVLKPRLERRAQFALGAERIRDLPPFCGEFLVARGRGETGSLFAALWTSPLAADECAGIGALLDEIRSESYAAVRHGGPILAAPPRLVLVQ